MLVPTPDAGSMIPSVDLAEALDLTTVAQPIPEQGRLAARVLLRQLGLDLPATATTVLPTRLVIRGSTAPAPTGREHSDTAEN